MDFILSHHIALSLLAGFFLDCLIGDPHCFVHPVRIMGFLITFLEKRLNWPSDSEKVQKMKGLFLVFTVISFSFLIPASLLFLLRLVNPYIFFIAESIMCYQCIAARSLCSESMKVYHAMKKADINEARKALSMIVGRDTNILDKKGIAKAAVETIAENASDGVVAPIFFMAIFGATGGMVYKAINTMDSMIAYKNERFKNFGFFAAKFDDFANFLPARLCALLMIISTAILYLFPTKKKFSPLNATKIFIRDRYKHASPNSAQTESVAAGALGIQLAGDTVYGGITEKKDFIGEKKREIEDTDIIRTNILMYITTILCVTFSVMIRI